MLSRFIVAASVLSLSVAAVAMPANDGAYPPATTTVTVTQTATAPEPISSAPLAPSSAATQSTLYSLTPALTHQSSNPHIGILLELGIVVEGVDVLLGLNCNPIVGGQCSSNVVCCENNAVAGSVAL
ncbi:fungal hydrophobin [Ganoderma leucocontextum]|nr:fungal hydrophobin [Ganoderma leucocontextum]